MLLVLFLIIICSHVSMNQDSGPEYADVVFLVDSSDHLGIKSFPLVKTFINKVITSLPIEASKYRVALAQYSDKLHSEFQLNTFKGRNPMLNHLKKNFVFMGGALRIGNALREAHRTYFSGPANGRDKKLFPPVLVVLASAESEDDVEEASKALREDGVRIISVGLQKASEENLKAMATAQFHVNLRTVRDLSTFSQNMTQIIKEATQYKAGAVDDVLMEVCQGPSVADVVFLLDVSVNGSQDNLDYLKEFLEESISALDIKENCMRVSLVAYSNETQVINSLSRGINKSEVLQSIQGLSPQAGKAYTGAAIRKIRKEVFSAQNGSRKNQGVPQIAVLVTHRPSEDNVTKAALNLRRQGVAIFTMGVEGASDSQLERIASHPAELYVSKLKTFSDLAAHNQTFLKKLRKQITHTVSVFSERTETLKSGCVDTEEADIYLLIDGSGSTQATDFQEMKTFLSEVVRMFNIAPQKVRVGAVQYADSWDLEFEINKYSNKQDVGKAIENIRQLGGSTNTGAALNFTLGLLQKAKQQRGDRVPCHLVVLTNGMSQDSILEPANRLREELIRVYAIGVKGANQTQLREIAGEEKRVYYVHDFDALKDIRNQVVQEICTEEACKEMKADIMFLVDSSGSIGLDNFIKMKTFMKSLVSKSQIGADRVQVGVVQFSDINKEEFQLNRYISQSEISDAIDRMPHIGQTTMTGSALTFVSQYFSPTKGARANVRKFLILITDGEAHDIVKDPAVALRQEGIIIYSVGVFGSNVTQLEEISGRPDMVFYVENFDILQHIEDDLVFGICSPREECKRIEVLDVVFVIDSSGSINYDEYGIMKDFMINLVKKADVGKNQVRFGAMKYADDPEVLFYLDELDTKLEVISALQNDQPIGGNTYTAEALDFSDHMFTEARGSRLHRGVPQVLIVITDGESHDTAKLNATAKALRDKGILVLAVGIEGANPVELLAMAGSRDKYFFVETFGGLKGIYSDVSASVCNSSQVDCEIEKVDLVFLMDGSNSIHEDDFKKMKAFLASIVQDFDVRANRVRIGAAQFSHTYRPEFPLGTFVGKKEISLQIENIQQIFGYTHIGAALQMVGQFFRPDMGSRINTGTPQVLLVLTDGQSQDEVAQAAEDLRHKGIDIYSVGIGNVDDQQLIQITGTASKKLTVDNFDELQKVKKRIIRNICTVGGDSNCFVDVVVGFDISTQQKGQTLLDGQSWMETYLPDILRAISSLNGVSCEVGTETQVSVAFQVTNATEKYSPKFEIYSENILNSLKDVTVKGPSFLNANFLSSLWDAFQNKSAARGKVVLLFSDGLDDDIEKLEQKSDALRKEGLNALITVALTGATDSSDLTDLLYIEFGKGFEYKTQFTIGMRDLGSQLSKQLVNVAERTCCCLFCKCIGGDGTAGDPGPPGKKGLPGFKGSEGYLGEEGIAGERGATGPVGEQGTKGCYGAKGPKGDNGLPGRKGEKGDEGSQGLPGFDNSIEGPKGLKGERGREGTTGTPGPDGLEGSLGLKGPQVQLRLINTQKCGEGLGGLQDQEERQGVEAIWEAKEIKVMMATQGMAASEVKEQRDKKDSLEKVDLRQTWGREYCSSFNASEKVDDCLLLVSKFTPSGCQGKPKCPVHPTELVFALDQSRDVTEQEFEQMKQVMSSLVSGVQVRENSCPVGARVAVVSYNSHARHLIRFSDTHRKSKLLREIEAIPYERSSDSREIGKAMRFISRNVFKRTLPGARTRRIATLFSSGQSADVQSIATAAMEFSALDIVPVVIAFSNVPAIRRAFAIDDTGTFQVIVVPSGTDYTPALERLQRCTFCYDVCKPDASCDQARPPPVQSHMDVAFLLDASRHVGSAEFEDMRDFLGALLDHFEITPEPETSVTGDRVALLSHAPPNFLPNTRKSPVRTEFNLTTYNSRRRMKRHVEESVQQLNGDAFIGHALQWTLDNIFLSAPNLRRNKVIFVISAGETSHLDRETLKKESLKAKCQGYALFVFSFGPTWNDKELEDLASHPLDHHLVQLGRIHKPDHRYGVKFVKSFINSVRRALNKYPPINFKTKCNRLSSTNVKQPPQQLRRYYLLGIT
ncbi:Collagen alpha-6(VI) chain [Myotis brandtii]|uniref:Collagen alpha-6(VI) chain n=1 Tax=Myotis brandtii TaxID=109478 RepID=S7PDX4_MYOBR|nr:Collagen alpha-6(VI) chain [Myotis brandtii]